MIDCQLQGKQACRTRIDLAAGRSWPPVASCGRLLGRRCSLIGLGGRPGSRPPSRAMGDQASACFRPELKRKPMTHHAGQRFTCVLSAKADELDTRPANCLFSAIRPTGANESSTGCRRTIDSQSASVPIEMSGQFSPCLFQPLATSSQVEQLQA